MKTVPRQQVSLRLPMDVKQAAERRAVAERRSLAGQIEKALSDDLVRAGYLPRCDGANLGLKDSK
jgi:hypothetical protein